MGIVVDIKPPYLFFVSLVLFPTAKSISDSEALLQLKEAFTDSNALDSWKPETNPCAKNNHWVGVVCHNGIVTDLRLGQMNLSGNINVDALVQIPSLRSLSFTHNSFSGPIPEFNRMGAVKGIYLTGNQFSGEISSDYFVKMGSLRKLWLSDNKFTGEIPSSLARLSRILELHLENNQFSGTIPALKQTTLVSLNVSNNNLTGEIPPNLSRFNENSFKGNPGLCREKLDNHCSKPSVESHSHKNKDDTNWKISIGFLIASGIILVLMLIAIILLRRRQEFDLHGMDTGILDPSVGGMPLLGSSKKDLAPSQRRFGSSRKGSTRIGNLVMVNDEKGEFGLADLMKAAAEVLGSGAVGSSYKATMYSGLTVVVKRIKETNKIGKDVFDSEMGRLGRLKHKNVLTPLAYHCRKEEKLLVLEYIPNGSLLHLLHGDRGPSHAELNWPTRFKIIQGIARGLCYLHSELASYILPHGHLKSSNVLLSSTYEPLLVDYGYASLINNNHARQSLLAYKSPEAVEPQQVSPKCDVYCLGIIILELLTGRFPSQYLNSGKGGTDIVQWANSSIAEGKEAELFDPEIACSTNSLGEMEKLLHIGAACSESNPEQRLDIRDAMSRIEGVQIQGSEEARTFQEMPSLRDGYAESVASQPQRLTAQQSYVNLSAAARPHNNRGRSGRGTSDNFAFDIS